ncbi:MAG: Two component transcriptional regulator, winged helix family [Candidatus Levybacteria bacterium GW2011_GWA2_40_8]|nr:MAG: Two component transcriptional regulator, winged helix family [Candidatus Levybacteria bacterium GW2011_GWA2_40_8]
MRVLVIEDEHKIGRAIKKGLMQESYAVDLAYDGEDGFDLASGEDYDVIILDLMLPKMDGLTVCKKLREEKIHTPILILTAKGETDDKVKGLNIGADDYLSKPFAFSELLARVRALIRRPREMEEVILEIFGLTLNTFNYEVKRNGKAIILSRTEFALLEYLLRHKGKILSKDQIINHVWNYDADVLPNTVEVYIGYLRAKVDRAFPKSAPLIKTIRGFGYKISEN